MPRFKHAVILAAGKGVRLDRSDSPKPLARIGHKPLLLWTIERLQDAGVEKIWIMAGIHGDAYRKELSGNPLIRVPLEYIETKTSGGDMLSSILALPEAIMTPYILTVSDLISEGNPYVLLDAADEQGIQTVIATDPELFERSGAQVLREHGDVKGLEMGVYGVRDAQLLKSVSGESFDRVLGALFDAGKVKAVPFANGEWYDVNTPGTAVRAEMFARNRFYQTPALQTSQILSVPNVDNAFSRSKQLESKIVIKRGLLEDLDKLELLAPESRTSPHFLLTDTNVDKLYGDLVLEKLHKAGYQVVKLVMQAGENAKNFDTYLDLVGKIFAHGMDEGSVIFDLGGGVVNNMAGFLASTLYRGIELIHIPTSTMAQVDAAIDFKQAVNSNQGKNLIGSYHPDSYIFIDPETIKTLDERHVRNGLAESIKHALAQDKDFFDWLMKGEHPIMDIAFWEEVIRRTIALKVPLLNGEQTGVNEMGPQYGHQIGHAIEHLSGYEILHGEAVTIGMCVSAEIARLIGACDDATVEAHYAACMRFGLPTTVPTSISVEDVLNTIRFDKHYLGKLPRMGLASRVGTLWNDRGEVAIPIDYPIIAKAIQINQARASA